MLLKELCILNMNLSGGDQVRFTFVTGFKGKLGDLTCFSFASLDFLYLVLPL